MRYAIDVDPSFDEAFEAGVTLRPKPSMPGALRRLT
jgi:hypothetical protein